MLGGPRLWKCGNGYSLLSHVSATQGSRSLRLGFFRSVFQGVSGRAHKFGELPRLLLGACLFKNLAECEDARLRRGRGRSDLPRSATTFVRPTDDKYMRLPPPELSRRGALVASCWLAALSTSPPSSLAAAPPTACAPSDLLSAQAALERVEKLLPQRTDWPEAAKLLASIDATSMGKALDACVDPKSFKEQAMNNAAFIVYYEEARYKDTRLEPQTPSLRAEQNGRKKEFLRALEDTTLELQFLTSHPEESDVSELRRFAATASGALRDFVSLLPKGADGGS